MQTTSGNKLWNGEIGKMDDDGYLFYYVQKFIFYEGHCESTFVAIAKTLLNNPKLWELMTP